MTTQSCLKQISRAMGMAGWGFIYAATFAVACEFFVSIKAARYVMFPLAEGWHAVHAASLSGFQNLAAAWLPSVITGPLFDLLLAWPAWVLLGGLGLVLLGLGRPASGNAPQQGSLRRLSMQDLAWRGPGAP